MPAFGFMVDAGNCAFRSSGTSLFLVGFFAAASPFTRRALLASNLLFPIACDAPPMPAARPHATASARSARPRFLRMLPPCTGPSPAAATVGRRRVRDGYEGGTRAVKIGDRSSPARTPFTGCGSSDLQVAVAPSPPDVHRFDIEHCEFTPRGRRRPVPRPHDARRVGPSATRFRRRAEPGTSKVARPALTARTSTRCHPSRRPCANVGAAARRETGRRGRAPEPPAARGTVRVYARARRIDSPPADGRANGLPAHGLAAS